MRFKYEFMKKNGVTRILHFLAADEDDANQKATECLLANRDKYTDWTPLFHYEDGKYVEEY